MATHRLYSQIAINAPAERVWDVLTDFRSYPEWNPFIRSVAGVPRHGARLRIAIQPSGGKLMRFSPVVLTAEPGRELRWLGRFLLPGLFDGEHCFVVRPDGHGAARFEQSERFAGLMVGPLRASLDGGTLQGFNAMNSALKARAEA